MSAADDLAKAIMAAVGENDEELEVPGFIDTGYEPLNEILTGDPKNGGIPIGRIVEIFGPSSSGKTWLATQIMKQAQGMGGIAMFKDHELTFQQPFAVKSGLNPEFPWFIYKRPDTWEASNTMALQAAAAIRKSKKIDPLQPIVAVFDSVAAMIPQSVFDKGIGEYSMNDTTALSRVASTTLKAVNQQAAKLNLTIVYLNQIRTKPGVVYGDPTTTPGGSAFEFYATYRLALGKKFIRAKVNGKDEIVGQLMGIETKKNKLSRPRQEVDLRLTFEDDGMTSVNLTLSLLDHAVAVGKLKKLSTGRIEWVNGNSYPPGQLADMIDKGGLKPMLLNVIYPNHYPAVGAPAVAVAA
jgi:recombination protein RecA